ncbi:LysR family transcriptional regulator [Azospira restricta]|uniref:LysR family transcriptional regulator n=2 Tax=Azospira restricta TaxID=404405 RepID=A0A974PVT1_9RHOO|nr:LysR family transcriptional regulator [Azospira restricta]QRJ62251.1 LysR family transcriptional regulator [Azospira restricta]
MDKLRAMETFVRIVEAGSLTAAAAALDTSLTSVVRSLATLEGALGTRLLNRTTRRIALTDEGREYFARCRRVLAEVEEAEAALSARQATPAGRLAITAPVMFGRLHVGPVLSDFLAVHPAVHAELMLFDRVVDLLDEGMDAAIRIGHLRDSSLVAVPLGTTRRVVCASPAYLRRAGTPRRPEDLAGHRCLQFLGVAPGSEWEFAGGDDGGKTIRVPIKGLLATNQINVALDACGKGLGCGMFLDYQVRDALAAGTLRRVLQDFEPPPIPVQLVYPHSRLLSSRLRSFVDWAVPRLRQRLADG